MRLGLGVSDSWSSPLDSLLGLVRFSGGRAYCRISGGLSSPHLPADAGAAEAAAAAPVDTEKDEYLCCEVWLRRSQLS